MSDTDHQGETAAPASPAPAPAPAAAAGDAGTGTSSQGTRHRLFAGVPRPLLALGVVALVFVAVATVIASSYGTSTGVHKPLTQAGIRRLFQSAGTTGGPPIGFTRVDRPAPSFTLPPVIGSTPVDLARLTGKPLVVNFWYSSCPPCQREAPAIAAVAKATTGKVTFVGVDYNDNRSSAAAFLRRHHETFPDGFDASGRVATQLFGIPGTPTTYFLSPDGKRELGVQIGAMTEHQLVHDLRTLYGVRA
jgi:thiol-disulfide isomerase/thioredoxin